MPSRGACDLASPLCRRTRVRRTQAEGWTSGVKTLSVNSPVLSATDLKSCFYKGHLLQLCFSHRPENPEWAHLSKVRLASTTFGSPALYRTEHPPLTTRGLD